MDGTTSKHLRSATELTLVADIKPRFVEIDQPMTYASRLKILLKSLFASRQRGVEESEANYVGPLERLGALHFVRWNVFEADRKLLLAISFDRPWEPYIRLIVDRAGPLLDLIFSHCDDFDGFACYDGYPQFSEWVRKHQIDCDFFYARYPETSVDDVRYLKEVEMLTRTGLSGCDLKKRLADHHLEEPKSKPDEKDVAALKAMLDWLSELFPDTPSTASLTDYELFARAARELLDDRDGKGPFPAKNPPRRDLVDPIELYDRGELNDVQGGVLTGYKGTNHGCLALVRFRDAKEGAAFLSRMADKISTLETTKEPGVKVNIALTYDGLKKLELQPFQLAQFPKEFQEGMEARAGFLGDVGRAHPSRWELPEYADSTDREPADAPNPGRVPLSTVDAAVLLQVASRTHSADDAEHGSEQHPLDVHFQQIIVKSKEVELLHRQNLYRMLSTDANGKQRMRDHFGFVDGVSQPKPLDPNASDRDRVALGEMVLGYPNAHREVKRYKNAKGQDDPDNDIFKDGTFLVIRKLEQHVDNFKEYLKRHADGNEQLLAAKLMGRDWSGKIFENDTDTLVEDRDNAFTYAQDKHGRGCPMRSHVRRANPRDSQRTVDGHETVPPRIARRGFSYGSGNGERGLMFLAYCASIADQYEVIQRWINGGNSTGLFSGHNDVLTAQSSWGRTEQEKLSIHMNGAPQELPREDPFVSLKWGAYLFVPSKAGLKRIAEAAGKPIATPAASDPIVPMGEKIIAELNRFVHDEDRARQEWKKVLEDLLFVRHRTAVWAAIRAGGGVLRTPYGVLVGSAKHVREIFTDEEHYSVREYWHRTNDTLGAAYLGMDRNPRAIQRAGSPRDEKYEAAVRGSLYDDVSTKPNEFIRSITGPRAFDLARKLARDHIDEIRSRAQDTNRPPIIDLRELATDVTAKTSREWFGLPDGKYMEIGFFDRKGDRKSKCPFDFIRSSRYVFYPHPGEWVRAMAQKSGALIKDAVRGFVGKGSRAESTLLGALGSDYMNGDREWRERAVATAVTGYMAATIGSFLSVMKQWIDSGELWRLQQRLLKEEPQARYDGFLAAEMIRAMRKVPFPDLLYRTVVKERVLVAGETRVMLKPGERVVVSLGSASADLPELSDELLFGGNWEEKLSDPENSPVHPCPGKELARGVMLGMIHEVLDQKDLRDIRLLKLTTSGERARTYP